MELQEIKKLIPKKRYELLELEVRAMIDEMAPHIRELIPIAAKDREIKDRYSRLKVDPGLITDLTEVLCKEMHPDVYEELYNED